MERYGKSYISVRYTREDFITLNLHPDSSIYDWKIAIAIFNDRLEGRYFNAVHLLLQDVNQNGFAVMALLCLMIETLYQFQEGIIETQAGKNRMLYVNFLRRAFPDIFDQAEKAEFFYRDIRCGILHSAQTRHGSQLAFETGQAVELFESNKIRVDVELFADRIWEHYQIYLRKLSDPDERFLRENFVKKMQSICRSEAD